MSMESDLRVRLARRRLAPAAAVRAQAACRSRSSASRWRPSATRRSVAAMVEAGHEIASHGWRWINYQYVPEDGRARAHAAARSRSSPRVTGERPLGWYTGRTSPNTRRLVAEDGGFLYDADDYSDDLPYWATRSAAQAAARRALHAGRQRHALRHAAGLQLRRPVLRLPEGQLRRALRRRRGDAEDDVGRPALPAGRPARPRRRAASASSTTSGPRGASGSAAGSTSPGTGGSATRTGRTAGDT